MKPEAQRIAIAEACGWVEVRRATCEMYQVSGIPPRGYAPTQLRDWVPDYLNDLNAMHEAEKILTTPQLYEYYHQLRSSIGDVFEIIRATAAQRAEAFLRTLNLWKDE